MADLDAIFKAYDVRGTVPDQIDADACRAIGAAFARFAADTEGATRILIGRDMRPSGVQFAAAFAEGAQSQGLDVVDLGLCSTDLVYFASGRHDAPGAMFTASHNPAHYNGIKFCLSGAKAVGQDTGLDRIKAMAGDGVPDHPGEPGRLDALDALGDFADHVRSFIDVDALAPLKVVADTANGMGGLVVPAVFEGLPCDLEVMYGELDGSFPNHPADPIQVENQADLRARVLEVGADVGLAFDGDADRVFVVDERGEPISGSTTTAMVAAGVLEKEPGATILHNLICSKSVPEIVTEQGGTADPHQGRPLLRQGDHGRHRRRLRRGALGPLLLPRQLAGRQRPHRRHARARAAQQGRHAPVGDAQALRALRRLGRDQHRGPRPAGGHREGGGRLPRRRHRTASTASPSTSGTWWFNLRPSNTEPLLRLNLEAPTQDECDAHVAEVLALHHRSGPRRTLRPNPESPPMALDAQLLDILACPDDKGPLLYFEDEACLYNPRLKRRYRIEDDIPVMLVDEATDVDDAEHDRLWPRPRPTASAPTFEA